MQQLIDFMENGGAGSDNPFELKRYAKTLLNLEREQIEDAFWHGADEYYPAIDTSKAGKAESYYNETFKQQ